MVDLSSIGHGFQLTSRRGLNGLVQPGTNITQTPMLPQNGIRPEIKSFASLLPMEERDQARRNAVGSQANKPVVRSRSAGVLVDFPKLENGAVEKFVGMPHQLTLQQYEAAGIESLSRSPSAKHYPQEKLDALDDFFKSPNREKVPIKKLLSADRRRKKTPVWLYVYSLRQGVSWGLYHSAIVIKDKEYGFAGKIGIYQCKPGDGKRVGMFLRQRLPMGSLLASQKEISTYFEKLAQTSKFGPYSYDILARNCNHFTQYVVQAFRLGKGLGVPRNLNRMARHGQRLRCVMPARYLTTDPVYGNLYNRMRQKGSEKTCGGCANTKGKSGGCRRSKF